MTLWYKCFIIKIESIIKSTQADKGAKGAQLSNILFLQATELHWPGQCVSIVYRHVWLGPFGQVLCSTAHMGWGTRVLDGTYATRGALAMCIIAHCILLHYCTLHQCIVGVLLGYFQLNENRSLGREHQLHPVRLGMLIIFTRAADCISMENAHLTLKN